MLTLLIDMAVRPDRYYWVINSVGQFDACEYLYLHHLDALTGAQRKKVEAVLLRSGKYQVTTNPEA